MGSLLGNMTGLVRLPNRAGAALALVLLLVLSGCSSEDRADAKSRSDSPTSADGAKEPVEPEPLMLGTQRLRSPCRLLTAEDVSRVYGPLGPYASFDQETREQGVDTTEMKGISQTIGGAVSDKCSYTLDNKNDSTLYVEVEQYASPTLARREWKSVKRLGTGKDSKQLSQESAEQWLVDLAAENEAHLGGVPVPGMDDSVLYVKHYGQFIGVRGNIVLSVSRKDYTGADPFSPKSIRGDLKRMRQVFDLLYQRVDDPDLDQSAVPAYWAQSPGWPAFVDPCAVFDDDVMLVATKHRSHRGELQSSSTFRSPPDRQRRNNLPAFQAVDNSCERGARRSRPGHLSTSWILRGEVWYAAPGTTGQQLIEGLPIRKLFPVEKQRKFTIQTLMKEKVLTAVEVPGADAAYLFDYIYPRLGRSAWVMASSGNRLVYVDAEQPVKNRRSALFDHGPVPRAQMIAATAKALENLKAQAD